MEHIKRIFNPKTYEHFNNMLVEEFNRLREDIRAGGFDGDGNTRIGHEIESFIVGDDYRPAKRREERKIETEYVPEYFGKKKQLGPFGILFEDIHQNGRKCVPAGELGTANYEINTDSKVLNGDVFLQEETEMLNKLEYVEEILSMKGMKTYLTGLPENGSDDLCSLEHMVKHPTKETRYMGINHGVRMFRGDDIGITVNNGTKKYSKEFDSIMAEALCTSFQQHIQIIDPDENAHRYINAASVLAAPLLAVSSNSPFLNGIGPLWKESRIPVFEQSIDSRNKTERQIGCDPGRGSFLEKYYTNLDDFYTESLRRPALLPDLEFGKGAIDYPLFRLQVGTDWRWIRPVWHGKEGEDKYMTLEFRPMPAGPTVRDMVSNSALYYGALTGMLAEGTDEEMRRTVPFRHVKNNFYNAAKYGMQTTFWWKDGQRVKAADVLDEVCDYSERGLKMMGVGDSEIKTYLEPIRNRISARKSPADWKIDIYNKARDTGKSHMEGLNEIVSTSQSYLRENRPVI
ncbi:MAG: glutamate-cysteine ligase family protein [Nanobdellota archaeon]